ncbi:MAG: hypothetical protein HQ541_16390, partial [Mariniphaga sp.]|nr:hypothetical protein [Mariniphaga sp.]
MRKFYTRLFSVIVLSMISLLVVAQPAITDFEPNDGACDISTTEVFTLTFNQDVFPVRGATVSLNNSDGTEYIPIQFWWDAGAPMKMSDSGTLPMGDGTTAMWSYVFAGNTFTVNFFGAGTYELTQEGYYFVTVSPNAFQNSSAQVMPGGIGAGYGNAAACTAANGGWDVEVIDDVNPFATALSPLDEATDVAVGAAMVITLDEGITWAPGKSFAALVPGDIALYYSTDPILGQYGGDVIFPMPATVVPAGTTLTITWPAAMPNLSNVYVRVADDLFIEAVDCCGSPLPWGGFNGNGQDHLLGDNGDWNFTTKDSRAPEVSIAADDCGGGLVPQNGVFTITIDEADITVANNAALRYDALSQALRTGYITFDDGAGGTAKVTSVTEPGGTSTVITVTPDGPLPSEGSVTVGLAAGLWDSSHNDVPAASATFTTGDFTPPDISSVVSANWDGTSFDLVGNLDEDATIYYLVQLKDITGSPVPTVADVYDVATGAALYTFDPTGDDIDVEVDETSCNMDDDIWARGYFSVAGGTDFLRRIVGLDKTHGTEFDVFVVAINHSLCGPYNLGDIGADPNLPYPGGWVSGIREFPSHILDILPPEPEFWADLIDSDDDSEPDGCDDVDSDGDEGINRDGALYVEFNEGIRQADGSPITPASLETIFAIENNCTPVGIDTDLSSYDEATFIVTLFPDSSFKSNSDVDIYLIANTIEDNAVGEDPIFGNGGVEQNNIGGGSCYFDGPFNAHFCVEDYCPPVLVWMADQWEAIGDTTWWSDDPDGVITDCEAFLPPVAPQVVTNATIVVDAGEGLYIPKDEESPLGLMEPVTNANIAKYVKIRVGTNCSDARTAGGGAIIYQEGDVADFTITITADGVITIVPNGFTYESETHYNIEIEAQLQNKDRQSIADAWDDGCATVARALEVNNLSFVTSDDVVPEVFFFEADATATGMGDPIPDCVAPVEIINKEDRIGVRVTEWVEVGFDGFGVLEPSETIADANALRRYLSLTGPTGPIQFDVEDFSVSFGGDVAEFYVDPYNYPDGGDEVPNWVNGEEYQICFISNPDEYIEGGDPYDEGALMDDHGNLVPKDICACFVVDPQLVTPLACLPVVTFSPAVCDGITSDTSILTVTLEFERAMYVNPTLLTVPSSSALLPAMAIVKPGATEINFLNDIIGWTTIVPASMASPDGMTWTWDLSVDPFDVSYTGGDLVIGNTYELWVTNNAFLPVAGGCAAWPPAAVGLEETLLPVGDGSQLVTTGEDFVVGDDEAPTIADTDPGLTADCPSANLLAIDGDISILWTEPVVAVDGQVFEIFESGTNSLVATIPIQSCTFVTSGGDLTGEIIINNTFSDELRYNTCYYIHFNPGIVTDTCGNVTTESALTYTDMNFAVGDDPAPMIDCEVTDPFIPVGDTPSNIDETQPLMSVTFTEPVWPEDDKDIEVFEVGETSVFITFPVDMMTPNADRTVWSIETADVFALAGIIPTEFTYGKCYLVNIDEDAFIELSGGGQTTNKIITQVVPPAEPSQTSCTWTFCILDDVNPWVKWWPVEHADPDDYELHIPTNAHLFAFISEPVDRDCAPDLAFTPENAAGYFILERSTLGGNAFTNSVSVPFVLEFIDNDKQKVRITPQDPTAPPDVQDATMAAETWYRLSVVDNDGSCDLIDENGNIIDETATIFQTEDITCPTQLLPAMSNFTPTGFDVDVDLNEPGSIYWVVVRDGDTAPTFAAVLAADGLNLGEASGKEDTDAAGLANFTVTGLDGNEADGYEFEVHVYPLDDEIDRWPNGGTEYQLEWPYVNGLVPM